MQAEAVREALIELGHTADVRAVDDDLGALASAGANTRADLVFNLVESLAGSDAAAVALPALLDGLGVRYTGSRAAAIALSNDKCAAKELLVRLALPTPEWVSAESASRTFRADHYIVKARFEHASLGLEDDAIVHCDSLAAAQRAVDAANARDGQAVFRRTFHPRPRIQPVVALGTRGVRRTGSACAGRDRLLGISTGRGAHGRLSREVGRNIVRIREHAAPVRVSAATTHACLHNSKAWRAQRSRVSACPAMRASTSASTPTDHGSSK